MSTLKISIARPVVYVKPIPRHKLDHKTTASPKMKVVSNIATPQKRNRKDSLDRLIVLLNLYLDAHIGARWRGAITSCTKADLWFPFTASVTAYSRTLAAFFSFLQRRAAYPYLLMSLISVVYWIMIVVKPRITFMMSFLTVFVTFHVDNIVKMTRQLEAPIYGCLSCMDLFLLNACTYAQSCVDEFLEAFLTLLERSNGKPASTMWLHPTKTKTDSPCIPKKSAPLFYTPLVKLQSTQGKGPGSEFDMEGWLLVSKPGPNQVIVL